MRPTNGRAEGRDFERELQAEIKKLDVRRIDWRWLNAPFTLWALSAVGISLLSFWFNGYSSCTSGLRADNAAFSRLFLEIYQRRSRLSPYETADDSRESLVAAISALNPDVTYIFLEDRGKTLLELTVSLNDIVQKWHAELMQRKVTPADRGEGAPSDTVSVDLAVDYWGQSYLRFSGSSKVSPTLLLDAERVLGAAGSHPSLENVKSIMDQIRSVAKDLKNAPEFQSFLSERAVIKANCAVEGLLRR